VRQACAAQHSEQLTALGVSSGAPPAGPIVFHKTAGYERSKRAVEVLKRAVDKKNRGGASAVFRELTAEPSGLIVNLLERLGTSSSEVCTQLDAVDGLLQHSPSGSSDELSSFTEVFVPAPPHEVWALLADPDMMTRWEPSVGTVALTGDPAESPTSVGSTWVIHARETYTDGKPIRVKGGPGASM